MAVTDVEIYNWANDYVSNGVPGTNPPQASDVIGGDLAPDFQNLKSVVRKESVNKSWERWRGLYGTLSQVSGTSFKLTGDQRSSAGGPVEIGRRVKTTNTGGTVYGTIVGVAFAVDTTITIITDSGSLDAGLSEVQFGEQATSVGLPRLSCLVTHSGNQNVSSGVVTVLNFDTETYDFGAMHDTVTNNNRITIPVAGIYYMCACITFEQNSIGHRIASIQINGNVIFSTTTLPPTTAAIVARLNVSGIYLCAAGDYLEVSVFQNSGGVLLASKAGIFSPNFGAAWLK